MLPRAPRTVLRAAKDDMPPYDGYEDEVAKRRISRDNVGVSFAKPTDADTDHHVGFRVPWGHVADQALLLRAPGRTLQYAARAPIDRWHWSRRARSS